MRRRSRIIIIAASIMAVLVAALVVARSFVFDLLVVSGYSMIPTIRHGDRILVSKLAYKTGVPGRGDIIAFRMDDGRVLVKRIVGLPGDFVEVKEGFLYRNGEAVDHEPYVKFDPHNSGRRSYRPRAVKLGHLFVMGDNRALSVDSKDFGPISYQDIVGKAVLIYFPPRRIGKLQ